MNVGSILNDDNPSDTEVSRPTSAIPKSVQSAEPPRQRNSIVSLLNDDKTPTPEKESSSSSLRQEIKEEPQLTQAGDSESRSVFKTSESATKPSPPANGHVKSEEQEEDEIKKLTKLKGKTKPKRYKTPPIWAQEWTTKSSNNSAARNPEESMDSLSLSEKSIFNTSTTSSVDLECSITGIIPPPSVTRRIAEWIYANFIEINEANRKYVELELKFGTIMDKVSRNRIAISVSTECIYTDASSIFFESGIHQVGFEDMLKFLEELEKTYQEDLKSQPPGKPRRKFNILETDVTDSIYYTRGRNEQPKSVRISKDNLLNPPRYTAINKQRISDLYIHNPSSMYDLRLSLSLENPVPNEEIESIMKKSKPSKVRIKQRNTFTHRPTITQFDFTRVTSPKESKNTQTGKRVIDNEKSYEVELEIDVAELFAGFDMFKSGTNAIRFEELVEVFINNARSLNNRVTKLAK
ncbi:mRNA-capping enzyme subunit beta [Yamadazyma tenuis]|uniref:mRNA-capping enzyme subunit beta n=1 Tax=Candida tenuis (strain ATCC 10573 / BCRC 21748 / CBS 615 / JCM 9827 / NBRC 10315 / NRRL Y-1498 / VKM Y-70) TaxID=590646 RepID=G3B8X2_CANTC|nr:uncharacterized protein CANTEDRAFT_135735 [Yamadazyma tenuis ATCC 10573]EGV61799.1 hypothetical protein CANTEDRAFT_135735 [Yamadazyma tenuis ATCC 10573]WEJ93024.1 mRNA-capping enzyme subunit beta [Yamadazyma tenuis]